ncbi:MAG: hypothetical protein KF725_13570 [Cyclobacteriaceae bacterium]|nr:hypothetical protein [Cyclobacteriaceae bacterium]UYN85349.1 MAG: hypothetical protein KIT51_10645 [Cyclobacteriaceae bacterium]
MKALLKFPQSIFGVALITALILMVPLVAMQFTNEVNWSFSDFLIMGILLFSTGLGYVLLTHYSPGLINRVAFGSAIGSTFLLIWVNLAVGLIGGGPNPGNLMYIGVVAIVIIGTYFSRFTSRGMERTMLAASLAVILVAVIALLTGMQHYPGSSVGEIIGVNAFFVMLFAVSGLVFRKAALEQAAKGK